MKYPTGYHQKYPVTILGRKHYPFPFGSFYFMAAKIRKIWVSRPIIEHFSQKKAFFMRHPPIYGIAQPIKQAQTGQE